MNKDTSDTGLASREAIDPFIERVPDPQLGGFSALTEVEQRWRFIRPATPVPTATPSASPGGWTTIVNDQFDTGGVPTHWSLYDGPYGSAPKNCAVPSHDFVAGGYLNLRMSYDTSGKCGAAWYTGGMQITHSLRSGSLLTIRPRRTPRSCPTSRTDSRSASRRWRSAWSTSACVGRSDAPPLPTNFRSTGPAG